MSCDADRISGLYERHAEVFDRERGKHLFERAWLDRFLALLPPDASVLDLGCGSGEPIARYFIENGCRVTGVDSSVSLVALCQQRFPDHDWNVGDMRTTSLDRRFHAIIAWDSFFHLTHDDQRRMFPMFREHAAPGAALMFTSGPAHGEAIGQFQGEPLYHASLDAQEYRALLETCGFETVAHKADDPACGGHTIWLAQRR
jgi:trans-aconitate methyltransferase